MKRWILCAIFLFIPATAVTQGMSNGPRTEVIDDDACEHDNGHEDHHDHDGYDCLSLENGGECQEPPETFV